MGYESSTASTGVLSVFDIATCTAVGPSASGQAPCPAAGTGTDPPKAAKTTSVIRLDVSVLPATTATGGWALTSEPSGATTWTGTYAPPELGRSGSVRQRTTK